MEGLPVVDCDVLILGASFAGVEVYRRLRRSRRGRRLSIAVVDRQAEHRYIPLVHESLVERLPRAWSVLPTRSCIARDPRARYALGEVVAFDVASNAVKLASGETVRGRFVVVALGSRLAPPEGLAGGELLQRYKFEDEFAQAKPRVLGALQRGGHIVVIGGGISGVELAGDLAHRAHGAAKITLIEAADHLLRGLAKRASRLALRRLRAQGVDVRLQTQLQAVRERACLILPPAAAPEELSCDLAVWAAGVRPSPLLARFGLPLTARGYLAADSTLRCAAGHAPAGGAIFACGDAVRVIDDDVEWPTMQRAIECLWQAKVVAANLLALEGGAQVPPRRHTLRRDFPYGISIGAASLIVFGRLAIDFRWLGMWFRYFLMYMYLRRYRTLRVG